MLIVFQSKNFTKKYMYTTGSWEVWGTISLYKIPNRKNLHRKSSMCCGDSTPFQGVFKKAEDFLDYRGLYFLFFYLMNIISKSSKHFQLAHSVKATVLNLVAYSSHTKFSTRSWSRHAAAWWTRIRIDSQIRILNP